MLVPHPVPVHLCEEYGSIFFTPSHWAAADSSKIPLCLLLSRLNRISSLSISSSVLCSIPDHLGGLPWTLVHQCLSYTRELELDLALADGFSPLQVKGKVPLCHPAGWTLDDTALDAIVLLCHRASQGTPTQLVYQDPNTSSTKLLSGQSTSCPAALGLLPVRHRTIFDHPHLSLFSFLRFCPPSSRTSVC